MARGDMVDDSFRQLMDEILSNPGQAIRDLLTITTKNNPSTKTPMRFHYHHLLPEAFETYFRAAGRIENPAFSVARCGEYREVATDALRGRGRGGGGIMNEEVDGR